MCVYIVSTERESLQKDALSLKTDSTVCISMCVCIYSLYRERVSEETLFLKMTLYMYTYTKERHTYVFMSQTKERHTYRVSSETPFEIGPTRPVYHPRAQSFRKRALSFCIHMYVSLLYMYTYFMSQTKERHTYRVSSETLSL